jgi:precorrin-2 dehydrogenase/sirohydrochlorin ferrochelatase
LLPIVLSDEFAAVGLAGAGQGHARRAALLAQAGIRPVPVALDGPLPSVRVLFIAGLDASAAATLTARARAVGILVNAEDIPELCDFHVPAIVRRGDLVLTASTGGRAPGLARRLREWLESHFGPEWSGRVSDVGTARDGWRADGLPPEEISRRTRDFVSGWLQ